MGKGNVRIQVKASLQNNYNVFGLLKDDTSGDARSKIMVDVITDGSIYVSNTETNILHAGESTFKEFEGLLPVNLATGGSWQVDQYGPVLFNKLSRYFQEGFTTEPTGTYDLWDGQEGNAVNNYKNYKNQLNIKFKQSELTYDLGDVYIDSDGQQVEMRGKKYFYSPLKLIDGEDNKYIYLDMKAIHFSKYYNVYNKKNMQTPLLHSLIYDAESMGAYNLSVDNTRQLPVINTMFIYWAFRGGRGAYLTEETLRITWKLSDYDYSQYGYVTESGKQFYNEFENDGPTSQFITNYKRYPTTHYNKDDEWDNYVPYGFSIFGLSDESSVGMYFHDGNGTDTSQANKTFPSSWIQYFQTNTTHHYNFDYPRSYNTSDGGTEPKVTLAFRGDKASNLHIFNDWFVINQSGYDVCKDTIKYKSGIKKPATLGLLVASVLANLYVYEGTSSEELSYIQDILYLAPNDTLYTKDIIYKMYTQLEGSQQNNIITFKGVSYSDYLQTVKGQLIGSPNIETLKDNNVNVNLKSCIKNVPLQVRISYKEPNLENLNRSDNVTTVKFVDGSTQAMYVDGLEADKLYQEITNEDGEVTFTPLNTNFSIRYLKNIKLDTDDNTIIPTWDDSIPRETNPYLVKTFENSGGKLQCKNWKSSATSSKYYSIVGYFNSHSSVSLIDLVKDEVLIPFAKIF